MIRTRFAVTHLAAAMMAMMALPASAAGLPTPAAAPDAAPTAASDPAPGTDSATGSATDSAGNPTRSPRLAREAFTTGAGVTDPGVLVLNLGAQAGFDRDGAKSRRMPTQLALGLTSWLDARVAWSGPTRLQDAVGGSRSGGGDPLFGGQAQALHQDQAGLDLGLTNLKTALGPAWDDTVVLVMTEFGRTAAMNGTKGTDHGTAAAAFLLGGQVAGGQVRATWPGLGPSQLFENRDLAPTADIRALAKGALAEHLGLGPDALARVFPGSSDATPLQGLTRAT